jgi:hypothetical protein
VKTPDVGTAQGIKQWSFRLTLQVIFKGVPLFHVCDSPSHGTLETQCVQHHSSRKTAGSLGLEFPASLLAVADEVIG